MNEEKSFLQSVDNYKDLVSEEINSNQLEEELFCECNFVSWGQVKKMAQSVKAHEFITSLMALGVGSGCGSCLKNNCSKNIYLKFSKTE